MSPAEDAALLLRLVRRHLQAMRLYFDSGYPDEEWGFQAQQALEKLLKARLVLADRQPSRTLSLRCWPISWVSHCPHSCWSCRCTPLRRVTRRVRLP